MAGLLWYKDRWKHFWEWKPMKAHKGVKRLKVVVDHRWTVVRADSVKRFPEKEEDNND